MDELTVAWPSTENEHGEPMLWFGSWLVGDAGGEGGWFYSGRGGTRARYSAPNGVTGVRIRRWPNEGFDAEYVDLLDLNGGAEIHPAELDFDVRQRYSLLPEGVE